MKEFIPGICWQEWYTSNQLANNALVNAGFKALRIFFNLRDLPRKSESTSWQNYIQYLFNTMPNGMHTFTFEGHPSVNSTAEPMRASFDFCKKYKWLPIVCMGTSEETVSGEWIGRVPTDWTWIGRFTKEFAIYLHDVYKFDRVDMEVWNEPSKVFDPQTYCNIALNMAANWKTILNYKVHVFSDDLLRQSYLDGILSRADLMKEVHYVSTHIGVGSEDSEWDDKLIEKTTTKIKSKYPHLEQALTEMSLNGIWSRLNQLPGNVAMYGIIGAIRNKEFGSATRIDDIIFWDRAGNIQITSPEKLAIITNFNKQYYKPYVLESKIMIDKIYRIGSKGVVVSFLQKVLNEDIETDLPTALVVDGQFGSKTAEAVKAYQKEYNLVQDGMVGEKTFKVFIFNEPNLWDELQYDLEVGYR